MKKIIDHYLTKLVERGINAIPGRVEVEMADRQQDPHEEWRTWYPIPSQVTDGELNALERKIGYPLPKTYRQFLKYKHFYALPLWECSFAPHPVAGWQKSLLDKMRLHPPEYLTERGRIPFADWSDWGLLCFDTTAECEDHDYPVGLWDHEREAEFERKYVNFEQMLIALDREERELAC